MKVRLSRPTRARELLDRLDRIANAYDARDLAGGYENGRRAAYGQARLAAIEILDGAPWPLGPPLKTRFREVLAALEALDQAAELERPGPYGVGYHDGTTHALELARAWLLRGGRP